MECLPPCVITKLGSGWKRSWALRTVDIALLWGLSKGDQSRYHQHHRNSSRRSRDNCKPGSVGNDWTPSLWPQHGPSGEGIYSLHRPAHCCGSSETLDNQPARPGLPVFLVTSSLPFGVASRSLHHSREVCWPCVSYAVSFFSPILRRFSVEVGMTFFVQNH